MANVVHPALHGSQFNARYLKHNALLVEGLLENSILVQSPLVADKQATDSDKRHALGAKRKRKQLLIHPNEVAEVSHVVRYADEYDGAEQGIVGILRIGATAKAALSEQQLSRLARILIDEMHQHLTDVITRGHLFRMRVILRPETIARFCLTGDPEPLLAELVADDRCVATKDAGAQPSLQTSLLAPSSTAGSSPAPSMPRKVKRREASCA